MAENVNNRIFHAKKINHLFTVGLVTAVIFLMTSWNYTQEKPIDKTKWLLGTWQNITPDATIFETWTVQSDTSLFGMSYLLEQGDTVVFESIQLLQENGTLYYIPVVKYQNDELPVRFKASETGDGVLKFENPEHDFPQVISYKQINPDSLVAEISGLSREKLRWQQFPMKRVK